MTSRPFSQVDVFASEPYLGNPVAVVLDASGITDDEMQRIARWTNLSETTFVLPATSSGADYRARIFTTDGELPFAGHPTLGTAHAWLENGGTPQGTRGEGVIVQECAAGLVEVHHTANTPLSFVAPPTTRSGAVSDADLARICSALGVPRSLVVDHQWVDNGPGWCAVLLPTAQDVLDITPDFSAAPDLKVGVAAPYPDTHAGPDLEVRAFHPGTGGVEDPVTGSLNASLAQWLLRTGRMSGGYTASQGTAIHRAGRITVTPRDDGSVLVGGVTRTLFRGTVLA